MTSQPVIFIGRDYATDDILDEIAATLEAKGYRVVRGWASPPPQITEYPREQWGMLFGEADVAMVSTRTRLPGPLLEAAPRLRGVVFPTIGTDSINLADAFKLGLIVAHGATPENYLSMAESAVMLMAALFLDLPAKERIARQSLQRPKLGELKARTVRNRKIGLIGLGRIARAVVERLQGWDAHVIAFDPYVAKENVPARVEIVDLATVLAESDLISVHVTLTPETHHMIGRAELARMKPGAYLVNTSRGGAIDDDALIAALQSGRLGGAALDVFSEEPLGRDSPLRELPNVILTSHMVGHTLDMKDSFVAAGVENIMRILNGEAPVYIRNPDVLPVWRERLAVLDASRIDTPADSHRGT